jgi:hypothetical protein
VQSNRLGGCRLAEDLRQLVSGAVSSIIWGKFLTTLATSTFKTTELIISIVRKNIFLC